MFACPSADAPLARRIAARLSFFIGSRSSLLNAHSWATDKDVKGLFKKKTRIVEAIAWAIFDGRYGEALFLMPENAGIADSHYIYGIVSVISTSAIRIIGRCVLRSICLNSLHTTSLSDLSYA